MGCASSTEVRQMEVWERVIAVAILDVDAIFLSRTLISFVLTPLVLPYIFAPIFHRLPLTPTRDKKWRNTRWEVPILEIAPSPCNNTLPPRQISTHKVKPLPTLSVMEEEMHSYCSKMESRSLRLVRNNLNISKVRSTWVRGIILSP